jgi:hypothetical protein
MRFGKIWLYRRSDGRTVALKGQEGNEDYQLGTGFVVHKEIISAVRRVEFIGERMSYTKLRDPWCNITALNVHAPCQKKSDDL